MSNGKAGSNTRPENDRIMPPPILAKFCVESLSFHFLDTDTFLEPCKGGGAFYDLLPENKQWCEIQEGKDFFDYNKKVSWIITNPPYSIYEPFLDHAMSLADNVVFLVPISKIWTSLRRIKKIEHYGGIRRFHVFENGARSFGFPFGFPMCLVWFKRGYKSPPEFTGLLNQVSET